MSEAVVYQVFLTVICMAMVAVGCLLVSACAAGVLSMVNYIRTQEYKR